MSHNTKMLGITAHFRRQDGKVDPPPPKFDRSEYHYGGGFISHNASKCREALGGANRSIFSAFSWAGTPQGGSYWNRLCNSDEPLSPEDRDYIEWLLEEYS